MSRAYEPQAINGEESGGRDRPSAPAVAPRPGPKRLRLGIVASPAANRLQVELIEAARVAAESSDLDVSLVRSGSEAEGLDRLIGIGPPTTYVEVLRAAAARMPVAQLATLRSNGRADPPGLCLPMAWIGEPIVPSPPPYKRPIEVFGRSRIAARTRIPGRLRGSLSRLPRPRWLLRARQDIRYNKELADNLRRVRDLAGFADIVVTSRDARAALASFGVASRVVPFGYEPAVHGPLTDPARERDLQLVSLAHHDPLAAPRRQRHIAALMAREPGIVVAEGRWGADRSELLGRTRVVLNVQRVPGTFLGIRLILALAAGAVLVTEPMTDPHPFVAGVHFVEAPLEGLLDEARALLADESRRRRIACAGQELLRSSLTMATCLGRVLAVED